MTSLLLAAALAPAAYQWTPGTTASYDVSVVFDGFLPILGGNTGKAEVAMTVKVDGVAGDEETQSASSEMTAFEIKFNGFPLPLALEDAQGFFPKTTVQMTPVGKITKSDAPDIALPVRLPGLDVKRFPDITYLPIELPANGWEKGQKWEFTKAFGDSDMSYACETVELAGDVATVDVVVKQNYSVLENDALEVVTDEKDAVNKVNTALRGTGTIQFHVGKGRVIKVEMKNTSMSAVMNIKSGKPAGERKLTSHLTVLDKALQASLGTGGGAKPTPKTTTKPAAQQWLSNAWSSAVRTGQSWWEKGAGMLAMARMMLSFIGASIPGFAPIQGILGGSPNGRN
jgi:hypothetical protein